MNLYYKFIFHKNWILDDIFNENELAKGIDAIEAPGAEKEIAMEIDDIAGTGIVGMTILSSVKGTSSWQNHEMQMLYLNYLKLHLGIWNAEKQNM